MDQKEYNKLSASDKKKEDWMNSKWRPAMGWMYMAVCTFDFILAPVLWAIIQFWETQAANDAFRQWSPLTLQGAGLFHMAMGAVLGLSAWGRTQEKMAGANNGGIATPMTGTSSFGQPTMGQSSGFGAPMPMNQFNAGNNFGNTPSFDSQDVMTGFGGKKAPPPITSFPER